MTTTTTTTTENNNYWRILQEDHMFLLRCALTHNWEALVEFCEMLSE